MVKHLTVGLKKTENIEDATVKTPPKIGPSDANHMWIADSIYGLGAVNSLEDYYGSLPVGGSSYSFLNNGNSYIEIPQTGLPIDTNVLADSVGDITGLVVGKIFSGRITSDISFPGSAISLTNSSISFNASNGSGSFEIVSTNLTHDLSRVHVYCFSMTQNSFRLFLDGQKAIEKTHKGLLGNARYRVGGLVNRTETMRFGMFKTWPRELTETEMLEASVDAMKLYGI